MKVPVVLPESLSKNLPSLYFISAWNLEILSSNIKIWLVECLPIFAPYYFTE